MCSELKYFHIVHNLILHVMCTQCHTAKCDGVTSMNAVEHKYTKWKSVSTSGMPHLDHNCVC